MPHRVFIDSNIWFSAFYGSKNCEKIIQAGRDGKIIHIISQQILKEIVRNLSEKKPDQLENFKNFIVNFPPEIVRDPKKILPDFKKLIAPEDTPLFMAAVLAKVDYFVTGNIKDFNVKKLEKLTGIKILTPAKFVEEILNRL